MSIGSFNTAIAPARAGGGGGGGHSSGSGGSSHSSTSRRTLHNGTGSGGLEFVAAVFAVIVVVIVVIKLVGRRSRKGAISAAAGDELLCAAHDKAELDRGIADIVAYDATFDADDVLASAGEAFLAIQRAWTGRAPALSRMVMAEDLWNEHRLQIDQLVDHHQVNRLDGLVVRSLHLVGARSVGFHDEVVVRFFASSADYMVDETTGRMISGHTELADWCEDWVFQRPVAGGWLLTRIDQLESWELAKATVPR